MNLSFVNLVKVPEIRNKIGFTLLFLAIYRIGFGIPLPGVNYAAFQAAADAAGGGWLGMMNLMTGAQLQQATIFSLGVMPYISASIIFSLLTKVVPSLEALSKEGAAGQRKINQYTRLATIPICLVQSMFVVFGVLRGGPAAGTNVEMLTSGAKENYALYILVVMVALTAGTMLIMWLGEQITEHGVGNGISLIIMGGIIAELWPTMMRLIAQSGKADANEKFQTLLMFLLTWGIMVVAVVYMTKAQRRIPIRQAKQARGRQVYGGQAHFLPIKVNSAGVMPIIFGSALLMIPVMLGKALGWTWLENNFQGRGFWYVVTFAGLIFFFSFFWTSMMFQPADMANNLKEHGSFIPGIRPGKNTAEFLERTMERITLVGAAFLATIAVFPTFMQDANTFAGMEGRMIYFMSGTSILIVVGVALDLVEKLNALLVMRNYEGFVEGKTGAGDAQAATGGGWGRRGG